MTNLSSIDGGLLTVRVLEAKGLKLPGGVELPKGMPTAAGGLSGRRDSVIRQGNWFLPYLVLTFDRNEVIIDAIGGTLSAPAYHFSTSFDVSRPSSIGISSYLRTSPPGSTTHPSSHRPPSSAGGSASRQMAQSKHSRTQSGAMDCFLGKADAEPVFDAGRKTDMWYQAAGGMGEFRLQISFTPTAHEPPTIDGFELLSVIGKGSFGKVMQVRKKDTGRIYALKSIRKAHIVSRSEVTHTLAERTVLAQVNNPFIVPLKFSFQSKDKLYLVLSFVNGGELFHHLQNEGRFDEERSKFYAAELLCALECLHSFDVVYRDLKPENILLDYTGHLMLCDFGLCKLNMTEGERTNTFAGTPEYLAPELILGKGYTRSVDWWTLGVLLYEMLSGLPAFLEEDHQKMYQRIISETLTFPPTITGEARRILTGLLQKDPAKRLGANGAEEIKRHLFFHGLDWGKLGRREITPPFRPSVESAIDTANVDSDFLSEAPMDSVVEDSVLSQSTQAQFEGFSYVGRGGVMGESVR